MTDEAKKTEKPTIECRVCGHKYPYLPFYHRERKIEEHKRVCVECIRLWELGKKTDKARKGDGKVIKANVKLVLKTDGKDGNPEGPTEIKSRDIIAAMGAVKLRGTDDGNVWKGPESEVNVGVAGGWDFGGSEPVYVPEARAKAMDKLITAFHSALAKARVDGFNEGRNLIAALAKGEVKLESYDVQVDNARAGKKPKSRMGWDD